MNDHTDAPAADLVERLNYRRTRLDKIDEPAMYCPFDAKLDEEAAARIRSLEASCAAYREQVITLDLMKASAEAQRDEAVSAMEIASRCLLGIPKPRINNGVMVAWSVSDDVPEDIFTALSHLSAFLDSLKEGR